MISKHVAGIADENGRLPAYAWPGGYQLFYVDNHDCVLCPDCANDHDNYGGGTVVAYDINYEDATLSCDACNKWIDPSYLDGKELITARFGTGEENE